MTSKPINPPSLSMPQVRICQPPFRSTNPLGVRLANSMSSSDAKSVSSESDEADEMGSYLDPFLAMWVL